MDDNIDNKMPGLEEEGKDRVDGEVERAEEKDIPGESGEGVSPEGEKVEDNSKEVRKMV